MNKRFRIVLGILLVTLLGVFVCLVVPMGNPEPMYQGQPLGYWIKMINFMTQDDTGSGGYWVGERPVLKIGPQAIPFLIKTLKKKDSRLNDAYVDLWSKVPGRFQRHLAMPQKSATMRANAARGLKLFGPLAAVAVPDLIVALNDKDPLVRSAAADAFETIGPEARAAVPLLVRGLNDPDKNMRLACLIGLTGAGQDSLEVVPVFQLLLKDNDSNTRAWAVMGLGKMTVKREAVVQALMEALQDDVPTVRDRAAQALGRFGPNASDAVPALLSRLETDSKRTNDFGSEIVVWKILEALEKIGPGARGAIPDLTNLLSGTNQMFRVYSASALWAIQPHNPLTIPDLMESLKRGESGQFGALRALGRVGPEAADASALVETFTTNKNLQIQMEATVAAWRIKPAGAPPLELLVNTYHSREHGLIRRNAIELLGELGPAAREAIPVIIEATKDNEQLTREFAREALNKVGNK